MCFVGINRPKFTKEIGYRFRTLRSLSSANYYAIVQLSWSRELLGIDSIVRALNSDIKIGMNGSYQNSSKIQLAVGDLFYTDTYRPPCDFQFHGVVNRWFADRVNDILFAKRRSSACTPDVSSGHCIKKQPVFYVFPGASGSRLMSSKRWPEENFAQLIDRIVERTKWDCIIAGSAEEKSILQRTASFVGSTNVSVAAGTMSISEIYAKIERSSLVVGNDSGPVHIAALAGTKALAICGGGHPNSFFPYPEHYEGANAEVRTVRNVMECYGCGWSCTHKDRYMNEAYPCISSVSVDDVLACLKDLLDLSSDEVARTNSTARQN